MKELAGKMHRNERTNLSGKDKFAFAFLFIYLYSGLKQKCVFLQSSPYQFSKQNSLVSELITTL